MTEKNMADISFEGEQTFPETGDDTSEDSPTENNETDDTQTDQGDDENTDQEGQKPDPDKDVPFHKHPAWQRREEEWKSRFNEQEQRFQDDIKSIREEFGEARKENAEQTEIPSWFGGDQDQWNAYRKDQDRLIKQAEERALKSFEEKNAQKTKAVQEATDYMNSEITAIESDKTLNPEGDKIDANKLLKIVMDNDLVDSKGRWNYKAGWAIMQSQSKNQPAKPQTDRKAIAGATTQDSQRGETKPTAFKTTEDFKSNRPW